MKSNLWKALIILALALQLVFSGCSDDKSKNPLAGDDAPEIPPVSSFLIDFSDFTALEDAPKITVQDQPQSKLNWGWAAGNVFVWNTIITATLAVPVASFLESFHHDPVQQEDGSWVWSYSFTLFSQQHTAELHAALDTAGIQWDMYITKQGEYTKFHWFEGRSNLFTTDGTWTLYQNPVDPSPLIYIEWDRDSVTQTFNTKYTNIIPENQDYGSYIHYGITNETPYDAFYSIYSVLKENTTQIEWNRTTKAGHVNDPFHFGNSNWHCWDEYLDDGDCQ